LAPTPAQLGRAPLQRRQSMGVKVASLGLQPNPSEDGQPATPTVNQAISQPMTPQSAPPTISNAKPLTPIVTPSSTQPATPSTAQAPEESAEDGEAAGAPLPSPASKKHLFKRTVGDGMDKVLEQVNFERKFSSLPEFRPEEIQSPSAIASPRVFGQIRRPPQRQGDDDLESDTPISATPKSTKLVGSTFFGPDFNPDAFRGESRFTSVDLLGKKCVRRFSSFIF